ncbi:MAG: glycosyltransferase [Cyanobacteria bacterium P01_D01_bin.156]
MSYLPFLLVIPIILSLLLRLATHWQTWAYFHQVKQQPESTWQPTVSMIVPVKGLDEQASLNFSSLCQQTYAAPYEVIFALETEDDPAFPAIQELIQRYPKRGKLVLSDSLGLTAVGKIKNLIAGYGASQHDVIVLVDSDVRVASDFLSQSVGFVEAPETGAAFAAPVSYGSEDWVAALHNITVNTSALNYGAAAYQQRNNSVVGSIIVTRRDVLDAIGGLDAIANRIVGIDVSLGQAISQAQYQIQLLGQPARIYHSRDTVTKYWWQIHRWLVTIRHYFPRFPWVMIMLALPLWWALLFLGVALLQQTHITVGVVLAGTVLLADVFSIVVINQRLVNDKKLWPFLWVALLNELISLPIFIHSLFSTKVLWRGRWLSISDAQAE